MKRAAIPHPEVRAQLASKGEESQGRITPSASRRARCALLSMRGRVFVPLSAWALTAFTITATVLFVSILLVAASVVFPIDFGIRTLTRRRPS